MTMPNTAKQLSREEMIERHEAADYDHFENAEVVRGGTTQPVAFRASAPLLAALDRIARDEHRTRAHLIQHVLWQYVRKSEE
jgi:hypothetical protein